MFFINTPILQEIKLISQKHKIRPSNRTTENDPRKQYQNDAEKRKYWIGEGVVGAKSESHKKLITIKC